MIYCTVIPQLQGKSQKLLPRGMGRAIGNCFPRPRSPHTKGQLIDCFPRSQGISVLLPNLLFKFSKNNNRVLVSVAW